MTDPDESWVRRRQGGDPWLMDIHDDSPLSFTGLRVVALEPDVPLTVDTGEWELLVVPLSGGVTVTSEDGSITLDGRPDVFSGVTDFAYVGRDSTMTLRSSTASRVALPSALASRRLPLRYGPASGVAVELRGAGSASREVHNMCMPETFEADRLLSVEVVTPAGNWSSYPPHKHDVERDHETELEEIYYFEVADGPQAPGIGYQRVYGSEAGEIDVLAEVRTGDAVLIPHGWHGPTMAAPGYDLYFLNAMAGPGRRLWLACDDPAHAWVRDAWTDQPMDPRLPIRRPGR
jgi:5-deoxy-glucuronate isomerase